MIVTAYQPNFASWTGYFDKTTKADIFVLLDTVPLTKGRLQSRVKIKGPNRSQRLTIPVHTKDRLGQLTRDVGTNELKPWRGDHVRTLQILYRYCPSSETAKAMLETVCARKAANLTGLCTGFITRLRDHCVTPTRLVRASEPGATGSASELLAAITAELGGDIYLLGPSDCNYLDESVFIECDIASGYHLFTPTPYPQPHSDFVGGLNMFDHLVSGASP